MMSTTTLTIALALSVFIGGTQASRSRLIAIVETGEYFEETYIETRGRGASAPLFVFFSGEPIKVRVVVVNSGPSVETLAFRNADPNQRFAVQAWFNGEPTTIRLMSDAGQLRPTIGRLIPIGGSNLPELRPRERLEWTLDVQDALVPGSYRLQINPLATDGRGQELVPRGSTFEFEIRPSSAIAQAEIARRDAWRHFLRGDLEGLATAELAVERLLTVHPTSHEAFLIRARIAEARGNTTLAAASYDRAIEILKKDQDNLLIKFKSPYERERILKSIEATRR